MDILVCVVIKQYMNYGPLTALPLSGCQAGDVAQEDSGVCVFVVVDLKRQTASGRVEP